MKNSVLYYPKVEFKSHEWLWSALMIWDRVYRIVPEGYEPNDCEVVKAFIEKTGDKYIRSINPKKYSEEASNLFLNELASDDCKWGAAALDESRQNKEYIQLHKDKADVKLRSLLVCDSKVDEKNWLFVPHDIASVYMLYLANYIADKNGLTLTTDYSEAWCGSNYFKYNGNIDDIAETYQDRVVLVSTITDILPDNISELSPDALEDFLKSSRKERVKFFECVKEINNLVSKCEDEDMCKYIIKDKAEELHEAKLEYKKHMKKLKCKKYFGIGSSMIPTITSVSTNLMKKDSNLKNILSLSGLFFGIIAQFWDESEFEKEKEKNLTSDYLLQIDSICSESRNVRYYQDGLNENLNHFIRD